MTINGNAVVVIQRDQFTKLPGTSECSGFVADALHQAAIAHENIGVVVDDVMVDFGVFAVELLRQQLFCQRHAYRVGQALTERAGGGFNAGGVAQFRVAGGFAMQLAKLLEISQRQLVASQVQHAIQQHGGMAVRQHKTVAVKPVGVVRAVLQVLAPQRSSHIGHAHGCAGVAGIGLLYGIHGQRTNRGGHEG